MSLLSRYLTRVLTLLARTLRQAARLSPVSPLGVPRNSCHGLLAMMLAVALAGCATSGRPIIVEREPPSERSSIPAPRTSAIPRSGVYVVKRGDTLYSIAWRFGLDMNVLARNNRIGPPYTIYPGQRLRLDGQAVASTRPRTLPKEPAKTSRPPPRKPAAAAPAPGILSSELVWRWPASSPVVREFGGASKGLDFEMKAGSPVKAAARGEVVYAGSGLGGYERLVILKHNDSYLSAYSLNQPFSVREGQSVHGGERIASIGQGTSKLRMLHFEIRRDGDPVSPRKLMRGR